MVTYLLDLHKNIRFSKTLSEYQEQHYSLEKTDIVFLDPPKKFHVIFVGYSWNNQGIFLYSTFPEHCFRISLGISNGTFSEYNGNIHNVPRIFHEHIFARWVSERLFLRTPLEGCFCMMQVFENMVNSKKHYNFQTFTKLPNFLI